MRFSSIFAASPAIAIVSIELLCGLGGTAQAATGSAASLPGVMVEAPKQVARPKHSTVARSTVSHRTSQTTQTPSAPKSVSGKLAKLASATGSCVGGCVTSFRYGNAPWHGCSGSGWPRCRSRAETPATTIPTPSARRPDCWTGWRNNEDRMVLQQPGVEVDQNPRQQLKPPRLAASSDHPHLAKPACRQPLDAPKNQFAP